MSSRRVSLLAAVVICAALVRPAHAEGDAKAAARAHFKRAEAAFNVGKFDEALAAYQAAYETKPLPGFLFNIAQCHRNLGNHDRALFFYRRYLALDPQTPNRAVVEELIAETERRREAQAPGTSLTPPPAAATPAVVAAPPPTPAAPAAVPPPPPPPPEPVAPVVAAAEPVRPASAPLPEIPVVPVAEKPAPPAFVEAKAPVSSGERPLYRRWGFWAVAGAVVAGGAATAILLSQGQSSPPKPTGGLGALDWR